MALSYVGKVRGCLDLFMARDDKKLSDAEVKATVAVGTSVKQDKLTNASIKELAAVYREGASVFTKESVRDRLGGILLANGAKAEQLGVQEDMDLVAFDALSQNGKMVALYGDDLGTEYDWPGLEPEYTSPEVRLVDTLEGDLLDKALAIYTEARANSWQGGGGLPEVRAIKKDGVTFGYTVFTSGQDPRYSAGWAFKEVYDRNFDHIGGFSAVE